MTAVAVFVAIGLATTRHQGEPGHSAQPTASFSAQPTASFDVSQCRTGEDANKILGCRIIATGNSVDAVWTQLLGPEYTQPQMLIFSGSVNTPCGGATTEVGPFYCPADQTSYFDPDSFQVFADQHGSSGEPFAQEYVVAHVYAHHVQNLLGDLGRPQQGAQDASNNDVRTELQANCYAGVWAHYAATVKQKSTGVPYLNPLTDQDIQDAMAAMASVGDSWTQKQSNGRVIPESWTLGSSAQRQHWSAVGYQTGDPKRCDTFNATDLDNG